MTVEDDMRAMRGNDRMREASGNVTSGDPLVAFLYLLARDDLPIGAIETLIDHTQGRPDHRFTNGWLARWAIDAAQRLRQVDQTGDEGWPWLCRGDALSGEPHGHPASGDAEWRDNSPAAQAERQRQR